MSSFDLRTEGAVALITGGASGIGRAVAEVFGEAGYRVLLADIDSAAGEEAVKQLTDLGYAAEFIRCDVADESQVSTMMNVAIERWQRIDCLLNNAGILGRQTTIENLAQQDLEHILAVDLKAVFYSCKHAIPLMRANGGGSILNIASITAETGSAYYAAYSVAKAGVVALTRSLARQIGRFNIRINCISPGSIADTGLMRDYYHEHPEALKRDKLSLIQKIPLGRLGKPRDIALLALFLASPFAGYVHGADITIDGGESLGFH